MEIDVYVRRYALLMVLARNDDDDDILIIIMSFTHKRVYNTFFLRCSLDKKPKKQKCTLKNLVFSSPGCKADLY